MSTDIQVISVVDDLRVVGLSEATGTAVRTLQINGAGGFAEASRVLVNSLGVDTFTLVSDTIIWVPLVDALEGVSLSGMDVVVVASQLTNTRRTRLFFSPTQRLSRVTGVQKLIQQIVKILLTNVGSNKFRPTEGGGLIRLLGFSLTTSAKSRIVSSLSRAISATESQLAASQSADTAALPDDERLLSLSLAGVTFLEATQEVQASVKLVTFAGSSVTVPLTL